MLLKDDSQPSQDGLSEDQKLKVQLVASLVLDAFQGGDWPLARQNWEETDLDADERVATWGYFDSRQRAYLKGDDRLYLQESETLTRRMPMNDAATVSTQIQEYNATEAALAELAQKYKGVLFDTSTAEGMQTARQGRAELRGYRVELEKTRVRIKEPALRRTQLIDSEARRITTALSALEDPIDEQIKAEEKRKEDIRLAVERAELARIAAAERARKKAEEAQLAAERAEIARRQAELDRTIADSRRKIEEEERAARMAREEADRIFRQQREAAETVAKAKLDAEAETARKAHAAEESRLKVERDKIEAERRAVEEIQRKERFAEEERQRKIREAAEAKEREAKRKADDLLDARAMLSMFVQRYGALEEFTVVVKTIKAYLMAKSKCS